MKKESFRYTFHTSQSAEEVFNRLLNVRSWWSGLFDETITGASQRVDDEFTFKAGGDAHFSRQKLVKLIPAKHIEWLVTDSRLSYLDHAAEWNGTHIRFDLDTTDGKTVVTFTHEGLLPQLECYGSCSGAWTGYLDNLKKALA